MCQTGNTLLPRRQQRHGHPHRPFTVSRDNSFERQLAGRRVRVYRRETWTFRARKVCVTRVCRRGWTRARLDSHARPTRPVGAAEPGKATQRNCCLACWGFRVTGNTDLDYAKVLDIQTRTNIYRDIFLLALPISQQPTISTGFLVRPRSVCGFEKQRNPNLYRNWVSCTKQNCGLSKLQE
jgi:hypothetical protein